MNAEILEFVAAMKEQGLDPGEVKTDGRVHRFRTWGDKARGTSGAYWHNGRCGCFQDWRTMEKPKVIEGKLNKADREALKGSFNSNGHRVSNKALESGIRKIWNAGTDPAGHPYLQKKQISAVPQIKQYDGKLIIPVSGINGELNGLQRIDADGNKKFLAGTPKKGSFFSIAGNETCENIVICEGFATGVSVHEATGCAVAVAFDAGNLIHVAREICKKIDPQNVIIAGDNDSWKTARGQKDIGSILAKKTAGQQALGSLFQNSKIPTARLQQILTICS